MVNNLILQEILGHFTLQQSAVSCRTKRPPFSYSNLTSILSSQMQSPFVFAEKSFQFTLSYKVPMVYTFISSEQSGIIFMLQ